MMRLAVLPILLGMGLVQPAQALDFHPTQSITLNWTEPGVFQFDRFTVPVGVTVSLPAVEAGLAAPRAYFTIAGDVLLEGSLLAPGWDVSMDFNGSFVSTPGSRIESHSLTLRSLGIGGLQVDGDMVIAGSLINLSGGDITTNSGVIRAPRGDIVLEQGGGISLREGGNITLSAPIPEPKTYAMLLAGLGLVGYVVRKRV